MSKIILITGTDTGVGKTVLTALLLHHLRGQGRNALAMKPFCSGGRGDARLLHSLQKECLTLDETNPFYFRQPLAPWVAAKKEGPQIPFSTLEKKIRAVAERCEILLIEGSGGILAPLGPGYSTGDLAAAFECAAIVVAQNRLGTINHTLLTVRCLQSIEPQKVAVVLMEDQKPDFSAESNQQSLKDLMRGVEIFSIPFLGANASFQEEIKKSEKKLKKLLRDVLGLLL